MSRRSEASGKGAIVSGQWQCVCCLRLKITTRDSSDVRAKVRGGR